MTMYRDLRRYLGGNDGAGSFLFRWHWFGAVGLLLAGVFAVAGCRKAQPPQSVVEPAANPVALKLLVVEEPAVAERIRELWLTRGEGNLDVVSATWDELCAQRELWAGVDAVIFPVDVLGNLIDEGLIVPFPERVLEDPAYDWRDVADGIRRRVVVWNRRVVAVPLGFETMMLWYRGDIWQKHGLAEPRTWAELDRQLQQLQQMDAIASANTVEPLAEGWAAYTFLARAAAYAHHASYFSTLFHPDTMDALIDSPPYVRALEELVQQAVSDSLQLAPQETLAWADQHGAAVAVGRLPTAAAGEQIDWNHWRVAPLPGATQAYHRQHKRWDTRAAGSERVSFFGYKGLAAAVTAKARSERAAAQLLAWITGPEWSSTISSASAQTLPFRTRQGEQIDSWFPESIPAAVRDVYFRATMSVFNQPQVLLFPAIAGQREYTAALDAAVRKAVQREVPAEVALREAAQAWNAITERLGRQKQLEAYRKSLGL
jgi:multiple sugar transport system substrate-binding protein